MSKQWVVKRDYCASLGNDAEDWAVYGPADDEMPRAVFSSRVDALAWAKEKQQTDLLTEPGDADGLLGRMLAWAQKLDKISGGSGVGPFIAAEQTVNVDAVIRELRAHAEQLRSRIAGLKSSTARKTRKVRGGK